MRRMRLDASAIGMVVAEPPTDQTGRPLVAPGSTLDAETLERLRLAGVQRVAVDDPAFQDLRFASLVSPETQRLALAVFAEVRERVRAHPETPVLRAPFHRLAQAVIEDANDLPLDHASYLEPANMVQRDAVHALNRASLAVRLAGHRAMGRYLSDLTYAALTCDLGMLLTPEDLRMRDPLTPEEWEAIREHVPVGLRFLDASEGWTAVTRTAVGQHHERLDGSGYPQGLQAAQIHPTAALLMVCDVYAAMLLPRSDRPELTPEEALAEVVGSAGAELDYDHVAAFHRMVPPYPVGTEVELSTGERAVVLSVPANLKSRPVVRVFQDRDGNRLQPWSELDLSERAQQTTTVVRVIA
ncbi:MAG: HD domain-containing protein [Thermaerobacter sp.]|nr:HD domain-containing protein [Thermaerobacter sp.]